MLKVEAGASTDSRPRQGFTPRRGAGLPLFGKSQTGPPARQGLRIDFQFDQAAFDFRCAAVLRPARVLETECCCCANMLKLYRALPFKVPYPVPFKLFGDETKGWIDVTYMNEEGTFRLARGNKGTSGRFLDQAGCCREAFHACEWLFACNLAMQGAHQIRLSQIMQARFLSS